MATVHRDLADASITRLCCWVDRCIGARVVGRRRGEATKDCPAFQSFRKATNPGGVRTEAGHSYPLLAKNAPHATHYRVRIEGAAPPERWVSVTCGNYWEETANSGLRDSRAGGSTSGGQRAELVLSISWEPAFCENHDNKSECASETLDRFDASHFTLHGLWAAAAKTRVLQCESKPDRRR